MTNKQDVVFITAIGYPQKMTYGEFCFKTWEWWCRKNGVRLFIMKENRLTPEVSKPTWLRYSLFSVLEEAKIPCDRAAMVDGDTMVRWDCPNFFELAEDQFCAVRDDRYPQWVRKSIKGYRHLFPNIDLEVRDYFNAGFVIVGQRHRPLFRAVLNFYRHHQGYLDNLERRLRRGTDQTPLNYLARKNGWPVKYLPEAYNLLHFVPSRYDHPWLIDRFPLDSFIRRGYIWHFNGLRKSLNRRIMQRTWTSIRHHYEGTD
jgi:lipopolysaccharide biosynthesis glycosyltransferase